MLSSFRMINFSSKICQNSLTILPRLSSRSVLFTPRSVHLRNSSSGLDNDNLKGDTDRKPIKVSFTKPIGPLQSSRFPGFDPVFVSPHIKHIRVACR